MGLFKFDCTGDKIFIFEETYNLKQIITNQILISQVMEQLSNQAAFVTVPMRGPSSISGNNLVGNNGARTNSNSGHRHHQSTGGHVKNQHSYTSGTNSNKVRGGSTSINSNQHPHSQSIEPSSNEKQRRAQQTHQQYQSINTGSAAPSAQAIRNSHQNIVNTPGCAFYDDNSSQKKHQKRSRVSSISNGGYAASVAHNNFASLSLENSFKGNSLRDQKGTNYALMDQSSHQSHLAQKSQQQNSKGISQTTQGLLQNYSESTGIKHNDNLSSQMQTIGDKQIDVAQVVGGEGLSPINGKAGKSQVAQQQQQNAPQGRSAVGGSVDADIKRQQMRQIKNLQKLQKSGQSRKKSSQFGKSNRQILLMSGTKSKMMEMSAAAGATDKSGAVSKGTATLIELRAVANVTPDQLNGASQTYNNASKLLASANEIDLNASDYGEYAQNKPRNTSKVDIQQNNFMITLSEDNDLQPPDGVPMTSVFDQLEEMQFMSYELGTKLKSLVDTILQSGGQIAQDYMGGLMVQADSWVVIQNVAKEATSDFEIIQESLRQFFDRMQEEVAKWKRRCGKLQTKLQSVASLGLKEQQSSGIPPKHSMGVSKSAGKYAKNPAQNNNSSRISICGNGGRKGQQKQSNSLNHSGLQSKKERLMLQKSLIEIVNVYDKNRTQIYSNLEEMESRVNEFKNTREKLNVQHLGTMTTVEQEMEQLCLRSARSQKSGLKSHRSQPSASKRPMTSLDASRRSSRQEQPSDQPSYHAHKPSREAILNTPKIMTSGSKQKPKAQSSGIRSPANKAQSLVPPLPIHMISNLNKDSAQQANKQKKQLLYPHVAQQQHHQSTPQQQNSARSSHSKPPPPESYRSGGGHRSHRSQSNNRMNKQQQYQQNSARSASYNQNGMNSRRSGHQTAQLSNANSSQQNITGALVNGALVNQVMLQGGANKIATSKFDNGLEADFEGDEATLLFDTERLKQFPEDFACLEAMDSTDQKILVKQWLFMKHERELKIQAKEEKVKKEQRKREQRQQAQDKQAHPGSKNRRQTSQGTGSAFNTSFRSGMSANLQHQQKSKDVQIDQILDISAIQLDSSLSEIGTIEGLKARAQEMNLEAQLSEMLALSQNNISGLKTVTQRDLVALAEKHWNQQEQIRKENRKVLEWSGDEDDANDKGAKSETNDKILAGLSVDEPLKQQMESLPISPSGVKMQLPTKSDQNSSSNNNFKNQAASVTGGQRSIHVSQNQENANNFQNLHQQKSFTNSSNQVTNEDQMEPSPIKPNPDASQPPGDSFYNDSSYVYDDFDQMTPQQVRMAHQAQGPVIGGAHNRGQNAVMQLQPASAPPKHAHPQPALKIDQSNQHQLTNYGDQDQQHLFKQGDPVPYEPVTSINAVANCTSNSEESSLFIQNKKSLEVITERQSEFSNTMGTYARPSQRSKQSKNHSSHTKNNGTATKGQHSSAIINGSQASLNNSSSAHVNSSRYKKHPHPSGGKQQANTNNNIVQSFVDITDQEMMVNEESKSSWKSRQMQHQSQQRNDNAGGNFHQYSANGNQPVMPNHHHVATNQLNQNSADTEQNSDQKLQNYSKRQIDSSAQFTDMAAHTPLRQFGASSDTRKQPINESSQQNVTRQQIAYKHLMYELKNQQQPVDANGQPVGHLRQRQQQMAVELQSESVHSSYVDNSCYVDESHIQSSIEHNGLSSVKKQRAQRSQLASNRKATAKSLKRSNSEVYIKDTSMQNEDDALLVPIMYAMEASLSLQQSTEAAKVKIDQSQLNNLTRYLEANNSARRFGNGPDSNGTFQINNTLYNQLQKLFMQHQTQQDLTLKHSNSLKFAGSQNVAQMVEQPSILRPSLAVGGAFSITSLLNEPLHQPHLQKRTLQMLQHLQGYQNHNFNSAVGLLFSNSSQIYKSQKNTSQQMQMVGSKTNQKNTWLASGDGRGLSPSTEHNNSLMMLKRISSPIVDYNTNNVLLDRSEIRKNLLEGYQNNSSLRAQPQNQSNMQLDSANSKFRSEIVQGKANINKLQTQSNSNHASHHRALSKEQVSSYVHQVKRPQTNVGYHSNYHQQSQQQQQQTTTTSHGNLTGQSNQVAMTAGISASANVKTGGKQVNQQLLQKSLLAYQPPSEFNTQQQNTTSNVGGANNTTTTAIPNNHSSSDYVDQSQNNISHSILGGVQSSSMSLNSRSVERQRADSQSSASAASSLQRKLRLKTTKQYTLRTGGQGGQNNNQLKPRPVSSMAANTTASAIGQQQVRQKSNGSQDRSSNNGQSAVNVSTISAKPMPSQFKILQFSSGQGGQKNYAAAANQNRDKSAGFTKQQLQSQPQMAKQQQFQLQIQQQSLVSQIGSYGQYPKSNGSGQKLEVQQKGPVLKKINIKKIPRDNLVHMRNVRNQEMQ